MTRSPYSDDPERLALKEWKTAVDALLEGELPFLMRKGGIHEPANRFLKSASRFWLFPTYEHQYEQLDEGKRLLKEPWYSRLRSGRKPLRSPEEAERTGIGVHTPETIVIEGWAETTAVHEFWARSSVEALAEFGIWTEQFAEARFRWKPREPLAVFQLQTRRLKTPLEAPADMAPKRCYSWFETPFEMSRCGAEPVPCGTAGAFAERCAELAASKDEAEARGRGRIQMKPIETRAAESAPVQDG